MTRAEALQRLEDRSITWDVLVIGGGATGLGCAVDAASRGFATVLLEKADFAKATSSRSTKLIHGGVRYLKQGNVSLVRESLQERGRLLRNAPYLVRRLPFLVPCFSIWERMFYGVGLKTYDLLAGRLNLGASQGLSLDQTLRRLPGLRGEGLKGGVQYYDAQFDDARLAVALAQTIWDSGGVALNYCGAVTLIKEKGRLHGVEALDEETGRTMILRSRVVINATGIFTDQVRALDDVKAPGMMTVSQGSHIVLPQAFLPGETALMIPKTRDGRVLFAIPWHDRVVIGTTDTPVPQPDWEPRPLNEEIEFLLDHSGLYLTRAPRRRDVLSVFAGLRPLVSSNATANTSKISRDHTIVVSESGLLTVTGGKWTTYRRMAEDTIDRAIEIAGLPRRKSPTKTLALHGVAKDSGEASDWHSRGTDDSQVQELRDRNPDWAQPLAESLPYTQADVVWAARQEMGRTVEDILARRTRMLFLDARSAHEAAPVVAGLLEAELGHAEGWAERQVEEFRRLAAGYQLPG